MERYESIETLAAKLNQPKLYSMSSKGLTTADVAEMKYNEAEAFGFTQDEYMKLKTYLKNHQMKQDTAPVAISPKQVAPMAPPPQKQGCAHHFVPTGEWSISDIILCLCFFPWNFCCCPPGESYQKCVNCGLQYQK